MARDANLATVSTSLRHAGHYITYARVSGRWFCFDDGSITVVSQRDVEGCFGDAAAWSFNNDMHAYLLFYQLAEPSGEGVNGGGGNGERGGQVAGEGSPARSSPGKARPQSSPAQ
jgi:hypothetical protein